MFGPALTGNNRAILFQVATLALPAFQLVHVLVEAVVCPSICSLLVL